MSDIHAIENHQDQASNRSLTGFMILASLFISSAVIAGLHGAKLIAVGPLSFDAGLLTISLTFIATDIISEVYGKIYAKKVIIAGFFAILTGILTTRLALAMPASPDWNLAHEYETVFGIGSRIYIAALIAYVSSQLVDITVFAWVRRKTNGRFLWVRNNVSTLCGGLVDAVLFTTIAFYGVFPVMPIIISAYIIRIIISIVDTPIVYIAAYCFHKVYPELKTQNTAK